MRLHRSRLSSVEGIPSYQPPLLYTGGGLDYVGFECGNYNVVIAKEIGDNEIPTKMDEPCCIVIYRWDGNDDKITSIPMPSMRLAMGYVMLYQRACSAESNALHNILVCMSNRAVPKLW